LHQQGPLGSRAGLAGGGAPKMNLIPTAVGLLWQVNIKGRWYYFTLRRHLGNSYLGLLQFYLNQHCFMRSRVVERTGKSPRELMTGRGHPHWLTLLGLGPLQPKRT
jgi:hypothetical protein